MIKHWTPYMEHFILTFHHQECWHYLKFSRYSPRCFMSLIYLLTSFLYLYSWETCYFPKEFVKSAPDTLSAQEKLDDNLATMIPYFITRSHYFLKVIFFENVTSSVLIWLTQSTVLNDGLYMWTLAAWIRFDFSTNNSKDQQNKTFDLE